MEDIRSLPVTLGTRAMHADLPEEDDNKYWIRITASNPELDRHNSYMDPETTLPNFEKDAKSRLGVALTDHHAYRSFGYGRSADARLTDKKELLIDFFIVKDMEYDGGRREFRTSEKLIRAIENDLVNQVSVEFYDAREICNICKLPYRRYAWYSDWEPQREDRCSHKMGKEYEVDGKMVRATYTVYDARLKAVSLVEFGSNRETSIEKKRELAEALEWVFTNKPGSALAGAFTDEMRTFMEGHLMTDKEWIAKLQELDIPGLRSLDDPDAVVTALQTEVTSLRSTVATQTDQIKGLKASQDGGDQITVTGLREALALKDVRSDDDPDSVLEKARTEISGLRTTVEEQRDEIADLQADAEDGKAYREARIAEGIKQGTRAHGDAFDEAYHREYYADLPMEKLNEAIENNKKLGDAKLSGGRSTTDTHEPPEQDAKSRMRKRKRQILGRRR